MLNAQTQTVADRTNVTYIANDDASIRCQVITTPGKMTLKLERQDGEMRFATRHGHTLDEVMARASQLCQQRSLKAARRLFKAQA